MPDIRIKDLEIVSGQEPDMLDEDFATTFYVTFMVSGKVLAALCNKQERVMEQYLTQLKRDRKEHLLIRILHNPLDSRQKRAVAEIMKIIRRKVQTELAYYMADEGAELKRLQGVEFDVNSSWQPGVIVDPRSGTVTFKEVEVSAWGDMNVPEDTSSRRWASRRKVPMSRKTRVSAADVPPDVKQFAETIGSYAKRAFPRGFFRWSPWGSGTLSFTATTLGKQDWANGIAENDPSFSKWMIHRAYTDEGLAPKMAIDMLVGGHVYGPNHSDPVKVGWRKKTGTPDQILRHMQNYFIKLRAVFDRHPDLGGKTAARRASMNNLRRRLAKLAHDNPELRQHLVPLLRKYAAAKTDDEKAIRKAADDLIKLSKAGGEVKVVNEDEWFGGYGGSDPDNPYLTFRFEREVPGSKRRLFCDVYVRIKDGKVYYIVDPYGKKGITPSPAKAWATADGILWPHGHPASFTTLAADILKKWEQKWGRIQAKKSGKEWSWMVPVDEAQERGLRTDVQNTPGLGLATGWQYVQSTGTYYYQADPTIQYTTFIQGLGVPGARMFWKVFVSKTVPPNVD